MSMMSTEPPASIQLGGGGDNAVAALARAEQAIQAFIAAESDPTDRAVGSQILAKMHGLQARRHKEADAAMGMSPALSFIRRHS